MHESHIHLPSECVVESSDSSNSLELFKPNQGTSLSANNTARVPENYRCISLREINKLICNKINKKRKL